MSGLVVCSSSCLAQAKDSAIGANLRTKIQQPQTQTHLFAPPELKLHALPSRPEDVNTQPTRQAQVFSSRMDPLNDPMREGKFRQIEKEGLLKAPGEVATTELGRKVEKAFRPEILHVGHVRIYSPIATAIARKNPLCLLDPMVLGISF
jgi:hypothetical protein